MCEKRRCVQIKFRQRTKGRSAEIYSLCYNSPANTTANTTFFERLAAFSADDDATLPVAGLVHTAFSATDIRAGVSHGKLFKEFTQQSITT